MEKLDVAVLIGSLRANGFSARIARTLTGLAPERMALRRLEIGHLPHYNQDEETAPPASYSPFRQSVARADAVLFITPEFNRGLPGVLKNAVDVASRPWGKNSFDGKPAAVISLSVGALGGFGANHALRQSLVTLNMPVMAQPEAYLSNVSELFNANGDLSHAGSLAFLRQFLAAFEIWVDRNRQPIRRDERAVA